ncbi:hypothetical protein DFH06DRAFT_1410437, partial [Mycena polygramma]
MSTLGTPCADRTSRPHNPGTPTASPSSTSISDPGRVAHVATCSIDDLITLICSWRGQSKMKNGDKAKAIDLAEKVRNERAENTSATHSSSTVQSLMTAASTAAAVRDFSRQVLEAVKEGMKGLGPTPSVDDHQHQHPQDMPPPAPAPRPRAPQPPAELLVTISMAKADRKSLNRQRSPAELKVQIETAMGKLTAPGLRDGKVHSVRKLPNGNIRVQANTEEQANLLLLHGQEWISLFEPDACVHRQTHKLVANYVPTTFDPRATGAKSAVYYDNQGTISSPSAILDLYWLHEQKDASVKKSASSLVVVLDDQAAAEGLIRRSLSVVGTSCPVSYYIP